jgi:hypothetical protein
LSRSSTPGNRATPPAQLRDALLANSPEQPSLITSTAWSVYRADINACSFIGYESGRFSSSVVGSGEVTPSVRLSP